MKRLVFLILLFGAQAEAQSVRHRFELIATVGRSAFGEDEEGRNVFGSSLRYSITDGLGIEPEVLYMWEDEGGVSNRSVTVIPHISLDFKPKSNVRPYLIAGVGWLHFTGTVRHSFLPSPVNFSGNNLSWNVGVGVKIFLVRRVFLAPDFRAGHDPGARLTLNVGFAF